MMMNEAEALAEAAYQLDLARRTSMQALLRMAGPENAELIKLAWKGGFFNGRLSAIVEVKDLIP